MKVFIEKENRTVHARSRNGKELLEELKLNPAAVIIVKNDEIVLEDEGFDENDDIKILSVVSGG